jgi:hypothetical protein
MPNTIFTEEHFIAQVFSWLLLWCPYVPRLFASLAKVYSSFGQPFALTVEL